VGVAAGTWVGVAVAVGDPEGARLAADATGGDAPGATLGTRLGAAVDQQAPRDRLVTRTTTSRPREEGRGIRVSGGLPRDAAGRR
jgi:hypothetical protein